MWADSGGSRERGGRNSDNAEEEDAPGNHRSGRERERGCLYPCHIDADNDQSTHIVAIDALVLRSVVRQLQPGE